MAKYEIIYQTDRQTDRQVNSDIADKDTLSICNVRIKAA